MTPLRWTLLVQLLFFAGWTAREEWVRARGEVIVLETVPVDPRDLWSGQYMVLRYEVSNLSQLLPEEGLTGAVAVRLVPGEAQRIGGEERHVWRAVEVRPWADELPEEGEGVWVRGELESHGRARYGIERYYFSESRLAQMNELRPPFYVEVQVTRDATMRVLDILGRGE